MYIIDFSPADTKLIEQQAQASKMSAEDYIREAARKAANNAQYLAMLDKSDRQLREGKVIVKTMAELEAMATE